MKVYSVQQLPICGRNYCGIVYTLGHAGFLPCGIRSVAHDDNLCKSCQFKPRKAVGKEQLVVPEDSNSLVRSFS